MKIAHLADIHLGSRTYGIEQTYWDPAKAFEEAIRKAIDYGAEAILISGDLFHSRGVNPMEYLMAERALRIAKDQEVPVLAIHGNHDNPSADHPSPYHVLENFNLLSYLGLMKEKSLSWLRRREYREGSLEIHVKEVGKGIYLRYGEMGDTAIYGVGYLIRGIRETVNSIPFQQLPGERKVLMLHQTIHEVFNKAGIFMGRAVEGFKGVSDLPPGFVYYALGHLHKPYSPIKPHSGVGAYSGSLCRLSVDDASVSWTQDSGAIFLEENERGFMVKNLEDPQEPKFVRIPFRDLMRVEISEESEDLVQKALIGIKRCYKAIEERREVVGPPVVNVIYRVIPQFSANFRLVEFGIRERLAEKILLRITVLTRSQKMERIKELEKIISEGKDPLEYAIQEVLGDSPKELRKAIETIVNKLGAVKSLNRRDIRIVEAYEALKKILVPDLKEGLLEEEKPEERSEEEYKGSATLI